MEENTLYLNEERMGDLSVDQRVQGQTEKEQLYMSRPLGSMYDFEYGITSLLVDRHYEMCLDEDPDWEEFNFEEMYR